MEEQPCAQKELRILCLNCQHGRQKELITFLNRITEQEEYDFILLQEVNHDVRTHALRSGAYAFAHTQSEPKGTVKGHPTLLYHTSFTQQAADIFRRFLFLGEPRGIWHDARAIYAW
jgi:endonuclease/exonuclease/phosphatase family metal-dependent hydrolase